MTLIELIEALEKISRDYQVSDDALLMGAHKDPLPMFFLDGSRLIAIGESGIYEVRSE